MIAWTVTNANGSISVPASVPGVAHMALMEANILTEDPLYRYNELNYAWVALEDFTYTGIFDTPSGLSVSWSETTPLLRAPPPPAPTPPASKRDT